MLIYLFVFILGVQIVGMLLFGFLSLFFGDQMLEGPYQIIDPFMIIANFVAVGTFLALFLEYVNGGIKEAGTGFCTKII